MTTTSFMTKTGEKIVGTLETAGSDTDQIALLFHGIFVDREENGRFRRLADRMRQQNIASMRIDLEGHGEAPRKSMEATVEGMAGQLSATFRWAADMGYKTIHIVPSSFSGALFALAYPFLERTKIKTIFLLNPVLDFNDVFVDASKPEMRELFSSERQDELRTVGFFNPVPQFTVTDAFWVGIKNLDIPEAYSRIDLEHVVVHGSADELVDFTNTRRIVEGNKYAKFVEVPGAVHAFTQSGHEDEVWDTLLKHIRLGAG